MRLRHADMLYTYGRRILKSLRHYIVTSTIGTRKMNPGFLQGEISDPPPKSAVFNVNSPFYGWLSRGRTLSRLKLPKTTYTRSEAVLTPHTC